MAFAVTAGTTSGGATTSPLAVSTPASVVSGDLLIAVFESGGSSTTPSVTATGWTALFTSRNQVAATGNTQMHALARISDGTEGASQSFTLSTGTINHWSGRMFRVTGHGVTTIGTDIVVGATTGGAASGSSPQTVSGIGGITVTAASAIFILGTTALDANSTAQFSGWTNTDPNSFTEVADNVVLTGNGGGFGLAWGTSTGTTTGTAGFVEATNEAWNGVQFGVKPAAGGTQFNQAIAATGTLTVAVPKQAGKPLALTATLATSLIRGSFRTIAVGTTAAAGLTRQIPKTLAVAITGTIGLAATKVKQQAIAATTAVTAALTRSTGKVMATTATLVPATTRLVAKVMANTTALSVAMVRGTAKGIAAASTLAASLATTKLKQLVIAVSSSLAVGLVRRIGKSVAASLTGAISLATSASIGSVSGAPVTNSQAVLVWSAAQATVGGVLGQGVLSQTPGTAVLRETP